MPASGSILMLGLPSSGRQTFLAALWHQLESSEIPTAMTTARLQQDREYLNRIRESWLMGDDLQNARTKALDPSASLHLKHAATGLEVDVSIPHISDETVAMQWEARRVPTEYIDNVRRSIGTLLFVHPDESLRGRPILAPAATRRGDAPPLADWDRAAAPSQVRLLDLLQTVLEYGREPPKEAARLAIIISAWDRVSESVSPDAWLERALPLLDQFRVSNRAVLASKVYGVSALGGSESDRASLAASDLPSSRVRVHVGSDVHRDLTLPLEFVTNCGR